MEERRHLLILAGQHCIYSVVTMCIAPTTNFTLLWKSLEVCPWKYNLEELYHSGILNLWVTALLWSLIRYPAYVMCIVRLITVANVQLWSTNKIICGRGYHNMRKRIKDHSIEKVEKAGFAMWWNMVTKMLVSCVMTMVNWGGCWLVCLCVLAHIPTQRCRRMHDSALGWLWCTESCTEKQTVPIPSFSHCFLTHQS